MLHPSAHCGRKISRKSSNSEFVGGVTAEDLLHKASRKLSELSTIAEHPVPAPPKSPSLDGSESSNWSDFSDGSELAVLDCSGLNLGQLPVDVLNEHSVNLEHLILDENELDEQALEEIPRLDKLETLSLNGNQIKNIGVFLQFLKRKCPNLKFLSLIGNPGWPHPILNNDNLKLYRAYALSAVRLFPSLQFLDTSRVGVEHAEIADQIGLCPTRKIGVSAAQIPRAVVGSCHLV